MLKRREDTFDLRKLWLEVRDVGLNALPHNSRCKRQSVLGIDHLVWHQTTKSVAAADDDELVP